MTDARYQKSTLGNGLRVVTAERPRSPLAACLLLYGAGSVHEPPGKTGVAHLTEHMMFRGSEAYPAGAIDAVTANLGGTNNAITTADYTAYYFILPVEHWRVPLAIEADRMTSCLMSPETFALEKKVALEERSMLDDDPEAVLDEAADMLAFRRHPYRYPVVGERRDIEGLSPDDLRSFYEMFYTPDNAILVVAGGVAHGEVVSAASEYFGGAAAGPGVPPEPADEPVPDALRRTVVELPVSTPAVVTAFHVPGAAHADSPALELLSALLSSGRSSRLYERIVRERALATEVGAYRLLHRHPSLFYVSASLHPGVAPEVAESVILDELAVLSDGVAGDELDKARNLALSDHAHARETCLGLAGALGLWELLGVHDGLDEYEARLRSVDADAVVDAAGRYLSPERRSSAWLIDSRD